MRRKSWTLAVLLLFSVTTGCAAPAARPEPQFQRISYHLTGGVAGFDREIRIAADGSYELAERGATVARGNLKQAERQELKGLAAAVDWSAIGKRYIDPAVADALIEDLEVTLEGEVYRTRVGTGGSPPPELHRLLADLSQILDAHRPKQGLTPHS